jgi:hypothetical protein
MITPLFRLSRNTERLAHIVLMIERLSGRCHLGPHNMEQASTSVENVWDQDRTRSKDSLCHQTDETPRTFAAAQRQGVQ